MAKPRDRSTLDLFRDFTPPPVVARFEAERVRAATLSARIARAVSECLRDCGVSREAVAERMSRYLDESVTKAMLDAYASPARESHAISVHRLVALVVATGDVRLLNAVLADTDTIAVAARYEALIHREQAKELREKLDREIDALDLRWRAQQ